MTTRQSPGANLREHFQRNRLLAAGVYDGFTALLAQRHGFDALWASGLGISAAHGVPDAGLLTMTELLGNTATIQRSSSIPVIADCDSGFGDVNMVRRMVRSFEEAGVAAVCIEDKEFPKRNSFVAGNRLADPNEFGAKVEAATRARVDSDTLVIARLESLVVGAGADDALARGQLYCDAGADALVVHSRADTSADVECFARNWKSARTDVPLIAIPTTYPTSLESLTAAGIDMVIFANQVIRSVLTSVDRTMGLIAAAGTSEPVESSIASLEELFALTGMGSITEADAEALARDGELAWSAAASARDDVAGPRHASSVANGIAADERAPVRLTGTVHRRDLPGDPA